MAICLYAMFYVFYVPKPCALPRIARRQPLQLRTRGYEFKKNNISPQVLLYMTRV